MLKPAKDLQRARVKAIDGDYGKLRDFCFDDRIWTIRYCVVDVGSWFERRLVLIPPTQDVRIDSRGTVEMALTKEQIQRSPSIEVDKPVYLQLVADYYEHSNWPACRNGPLPWGAIPRHRPFKFTLSGRSAASAQQEGIDPHLRSANEVSKYAIQALNELAGWLEDFIIDARQWVIRYCVAVTHNSWNRKRVLVPMLWVCWISWPEASVYVDLDSDTIRRAPEYELSVPISREYEANLFDYYEREPYWETELDS